MACFLRCAANYPFYTGAVLKRTYVRTTSVSSL